MSLITNKECQTQLSFALDQMEDFGANEYAILSATHGAVIALAAGQTQVSFALVSDADISADQAGSITVQDDAHTLTGGRENKVAIDTVAACACLIRARRRFGIKLDFPRFRRHISTSSSKLFECQRAQLV
jgi:hypothetical protein